MITHDDHCERKPSQFSRDECDCYERTLEDAIAAVKNLAYCSNKKGEELSSAEQQEFWVNANDVLKLLEAIEL